MKENELKEIEAKEYEAFFKMFETKEVTKNDKIVAAIQLISLAVFSTLAALWYLDLI